MTRTVDPGPGKRWLEIGSKAVAGVIVVVGLVGMVSCRASMVPPDGVARIGRQTLSYGEFEDFLARNATIEVGALTSDVLSALFDQFLDERLLIMTALDRTDLDASTDERALIEDLLAGESIRPDESSIATQYRLEIARFEVPARLYLRQLLFSDYDAAVRIRDLWARGVPYETLVADLEQEEWVEVGQEGEFPVTELPAAYAELLLGLRAGEVSPVQTADYGFHVFQVVDHLPAGIVPLSEAAELVAREMMTRRTTEAVERLVAAARERYNVRVFERNLPFNYRGRYSPDDAHENPE